MRKLLIILCFLFLKAYAGQINIYAASDLVFALEEIKDIYNEKYPEDKIRIIYGSSGKGFNQVVNGAPYDLIFSANISYVEKLKKYGFVISPIKLYAFGRIVLWTRKDTGIDVSKGVGVLLDRDVRKIAVANWKHAPYGVAAKECLEFYGIFDRIKDKLVIGENISQTAQYAQTGAADVGIVALSLAKSKLMENSGKYVLLTYKCHSPIKQAFAILKHAKEEEERLKTAERFFKFINTTISRKILKKYGFQIPDEDKTP